MEHKEGRFNRRLMDFNQHILSKVNAFPDQRNFDNLNFVQMFKCEIANYVAL